MSNNNNNNNNNNNKMKGLLKGLRYISQIFDNEQKEPEIQIGFPTDVKHVAHIGWDGPSVNSPSWMNEFPASQECESAPNSNQNGGTTTKDESPACAPSSRARELPELPKSSRRQHKGGESGETEKRQARRSAKNANKEQLTTQGIDPTTSNLPDVPKKSGARRKKSKDSAAVSNSKSRSKAHASSDIESESGSVSKSRRSDNNVDVDDVSESGSVSKSRKSGVSRLDEDEEKGLSGIS
ncbi:hypothetical protein Tsubulata_013455 [Turnera subulata]|uniref:CRIB domain-containing protein n=1 Tax=Turnera subulata TaxID=218843 RepID=A0A9Q0JJL5_9ROSI|nr:hypothetical protein Tsubulata_013455 [Turnera subulata]